MKDRIVFNTGDTKKFYDEPLVLPAAAVWNMDEVLMAYIDAGLTWLLEEGNVDWPATGKVYGRANLRDEMVAARDLARSYSKSSPEKMELGNQCLRIIADFGVGLLWD